MDFSLCLRGQNGSVFATFTYPMMKPPYKEIIMEPTSMVTARIIKDDKFRINDVEMIVHTVKPIAGEMTCIQFIIAGPLNQNIKTLVLDNDFEMTIYR